MRDPGWIRQSPGAGVSTGAGQSGRRFQVILLSHVRNPASAAKSWHIPPRRKESLLHDVLGIFTVAHQTHRQAEQVFSSLPDFVNENAHGGGVVRLSEALRPVESTPSLPSMRYLDNSFERDHRAVR